MLKKDTIVVLKQVGNLKTKTRLNENSLYVDPVDTLDELDFWEKRLLKLNIPFVIGRFEVSEIIKDFEGKAKKVNKQVYSIFTDPQEEID